MQIASSREVRFSTSDGLVKSKNTNLILENIKLTHSMNNTGNDESQIHEKMHKGYPQCTVRRLKRGDITPMKIQKTSCATEDQAKPG